MADGRDTERAARTEGTDERRERLHRRRFLLTGLAAAGAVAAGPVGTPESSAEAIQTAHGPGRYFDVTDYGGVGDGVADDTAAIQAALAAADAGSFGPGWRDSEFNRPVVYLPAGHYKVTGQLLVPGGVSVMGAGRAHTFIESTYTGTTFMGAGYSQYGYWGWFTLLGPGAAGSTVNTIGINPGPEGREITLKEIGIGSGEEGGESFGIGVYLDRTHDVRMQNVYILMPRDNCLYAGSCYGLEAQNSIFSNSGAGLGPLGASLTRANVYLTRLGENRNGCDNFRFLNCFVDESGSDASVILDHAINVVFKGGYTHAGAWGASNHQGVIWGNSYTETDNDTGCIYVGHVEGLVIQDTLVEPFTDGSGMDYLIYISSDAYNVDLSKMAMAQFNKKGATTEIVDNGTNTLVPYDYTPDGGRPHRGGRR